MESENLNSEVKAVDDVIIPADVVAGRQATAVESTSSTMTTSTENDTKHRVTTTVEKLVLDGSCAFDRLPPLGKKIVRIFVSSTFSGL